MKTFALALLLAYSLGLSHPGGVAAQTGPSTSQIPYAWRNVAIVGGGFITGVIPHPAQRGLMYAKTDIGGAYRRDSAATPWVPLLDWVDHQHWTYTGIESLAVDPSDAKYVYIAGGSYTNDWSGPGAMLRSADQGRTWNVTPMTIKMGGNEEGRGNGERLAVDPNQGSILVFGSRKDGMWRSDDGSATWRAVPGFPSTADTGGIGIVFVMFDQGTGKPGLATPTVYAAVSSKADHLYRSADGGTTWAAVPSQPKGLLPHRAAWDGQRNLYVTYGDRPGPNDITDGAVYKLDATTDVWTNVTPLKPGAGDDKFGYSGVTTDPQRPGVVMVSTVDRWAKVDEIFRSLDGGRTWKGLRETSVRDWSAAPWLTFGKASVDIGHWLADIDVDPFDSDRLLYCTGWGMWESKDLTAADANRPTHWTVAAKGIEECVVNEVLSPPAGAHVLSVMWDLDGFRHANVDESPRWGFFKPHYGRNTSIDFAEKNPDVVARVYGGAPVGGSDATGAGGSYSLDNGATWTAFPGKPPAKKGDGTIAVSADGATFAWVPEDAPGYVSRDRGRTWMGCAGLPPKLRVIADRFDPARFYALDAGKGTLYASADGGATFAAISSGLPTGDGYVRAVPGRAGHVWIATGKGLSFSTDGGATHQPVPGPSRARRIGFGKPAAGGDYPAIYLTGEVGGAYGFFRSDDQGVSWRRINDDQHQFGEITSITGDPRIEGRVYLSSRNRGILYGEPSPPGK